MSIPVVKSAYWALSLDTLNTIVQGADDINQCIAIILSTTKGTDPLRPTFGADLIKYQDMPIPQRIPLAVQEIQSALNEWEPRIVVTKITPVVAPGATGGITYNIYWHYANTAVEQTVYNYAHTI